jgi:hypothetical protein
MKIIACTLDNKTYQYLALDSASGGYPYWTTSLRSAEMFTDSEQDQRSMQYELDGIIKKPDSTYTDGTVYPNTMKQEALGLSNAKLSGNGWVVVFELRLERVETTYIEGAIKQPKGFTY